MEKALWWWLMAALQEHVPAMADLGLANISLGDEKKSQKYYDRGYYWLRKAAFHGNAESMYHLGLVYHWGSGTPKDPSLARYWFRRAADKGNKEAKKMLRKM
jgi:hypothetical protein